MKTDKKTRLLENLKKLQGLEVFESVANPVEWQKKLRKEWE